MKLRFLLLFLLVSVIGNAQYINRDGYTIWQGDMGIKKTTRPVTSALLELGKDSTNKALVLPRVVDTSVITSPVKGMMVYVIPLQQIYFYNGTRWVTWQNNSCPDDLFGSATWSGTGLIYDVTVLNYHILCNPYTTAATTVTLPAAHTTLDRKDAIICDIFSQVSVLPGVPGSGVPVPINPFTQKMVAIVDVHAGSLTPNGQSITTIYDENVEWASSSTVSIIDFAATTPAPYTGTVSTNVTTPADGTYIQWQRPTGAADISNGQYLKFRIKLSGQPTSGRLFLTVTFYDNATQSTNNFIVADGIYGLDYSSTDWQLIVIPIISPFYSTTADRVQFVINNASGISFQLDKVYLIEGSNPPPIASGIDWLVGGNFLTGIGPAWLGSLDKKPFSLVTTSVTRLIFSEDGIEENNTNDVWMLMRRESDGMVFKRKLDSVIALGCLKIYDSAGLKVIRDTCSSGGSGSAWSLTGNAGTTAGTNFIGTTDNVNLVFKANNIQSGLISVTQNSTSFGASALNPSESGGSNSAFGRNALQYNTTGTGNAGIGIGAASANTTGSFITAIGNAALQDATTGSGNTSVGATSSLDLRTGINNTIVGRSANTAASNTDSSGAFGFKAVAASHQFALSPYFTQIKATGITGATNNGYVLTTDGTGVATFQAIGGSAIPNIDSVLAQGGQFSADRNIDGNGHAFYMEHFSDANFYSDGGLGISASDADGSFSITRNISSANQTTINSTFPGAASDEINLSNGFMDMVVSAGSSLSSVRIESGQIILKPDLGQMKIDSLTNAVSRKVLRWNQTTGLVSWADTTALTVSNLGGLGSNVGTALAVNVGSSGAFITNGGALGTPSSGTLTNATGLPISTGVTGLGTSVATALAVNVGSSGAVVTNGGALGTPSSGTLTNATGLPISTGVSGLGSNVASFLATPSSANLASAVTDETGTGVAVFGTSPTFTTDLTSPKIIGGTGTTSTLTLQSTSGVGTTNADIIFKVGNNGATEGMRIANSGAITLGGALTSVYNATYNNMTLTAGLTVPKTITAGGTTGAQTINKISGAVNFAAGASTLVVTNSTVSSTSLVFVQVYGTDATATSARVTLASGSFTITLNAAATAETKVGFFVTN